MAITGTVACVGGAQQVAPLPIHPDSTVAYVRGGGPEQSLDLFLPKGGRAFGTVVFTYGGGWHAPRGPQMGVVCETFRARGFACVLVAHRLAPANPFPAAAEDEAAAIGWTLDNIARFGGDPAKVALVGHSSGAHLALLVASDSTWLAKVGHMPGQLAAVVGLSTPTDLRQAMDGRGYGDALLGGAGADAFRRDTALMWRASPVRYSVNRAPPVLLVVGSDDFPMLPRDAEAFAVGRRQAGGTVEVLTAAGRNHMGTISALVEGANPVLDRVFAFLSAHPRAATPPR